MKVVTRLAVTIAMLASVAVHADDQVLRVAIGALPPQQANPFQSALSPTITTNGAMFDGLTRYTRDGAVAPWLAVAWEHLDDLTWRFTLRDGVTFSNGVPLTARSVAAVVDALNTKARPFDNIVRELPKLSAARAVDDRTVEIVTAEPMPLFPRYAMMLLIPEMDAYNALGADGFVKAPVGTGPYQLDEWSPARVRFRAFENSWRAPKIPRLEMMAVGDAGSRVQALLSGQADLAFGLGLEQSRDIAAAGLQATTWPNDSVGGIVLVSTKPTPFTDVRVRRALNLAVNRTAIAAALYDNTVIAANQPAAHGMLGFNPDLPPFAYDPVGAKALLTEAGYPDGFEFTLELSSSMGANNELYQQVAADLRRIGVIMTIRLLPPAQFLKNVFATGEFGDAVNVPWTGVPVGDIMRGVEMHSCAHNVPWTCDPDIMPLIDAIKHEWDADKALQMRRQLMAYYHDKVPAIFLFESVLYSGAVARLRGYEDVFGFVPYENISFAAH